MILIHDSFLELKIWMYTIYQKKLRDIRSHRSSFFQWQTETDGLLIFEASKRGVASGKRTRRKRCGPRCSKKMNRWQSEAIRARRAGFNALDVYGDSLKRMGTRARWDSYYRLKILQRLPRAIGS